MANELAHKDYGTALTRAEYENILGHLFDSQATGDVMYASSSTQLVRLAIGTTAYALTVVGGIPAWALLTVAGGGTGAATLTDGGVLLGSGTGAITAMAVLADGEMIVGDGTTDPVAESGLTLRTSIGVPVLATIAETSTGTDTAKALTPDGLAGSVYGEKIIGMIVFDFGTDTATGDGKFYFHVPSTLNGFNIVEVHAEVVTAGTTNTTDIQLANATQAADILSTKLTIDSGQTGSDTAGTAAVIDTAQDDLQTNDVIRVDVDAVSTTAAKGLIVTIVCRLP